MSHFLINTPSHKRWWLPDDVHWYNSVIYGNDVQVCVIHSSTGEITDHEQFSLDDPRWSVKASDNQAQMNRKYPRSKLFSVSAASGGSLVVIVETKDITLYGERVAVAHKAWRDLFNNERSGTYRMLKKLCDTLGTDKAKAQFTSNIQYEEHK